MYSHFRIALKYLRYFFTASNGRGHGVHSPFVFDFITKVMNDHRHYYCYDDIENLRSEMRLDKTLLTIEDFGAGSIISQKKQRTIAAIVQSALKTKKFAQLMFRMVNFYQPKTIIELGTSLGITAAYLASAKQDAIVITMEGSESIAAIAKKNFKELGLNNIRTIKGNFNDTLPGVLTQIQTADFVFLDGNHRKEPTLKYFEQLLGKADEHSIFIFDDIHWSEEMETAWKIIQQQENVTLTLDLFFIGIVFFRKGQKEKQHFIIRF